MNLSWEDVAAIATVASIMMSLLFFALRGRLSSEFVTQEQHDSALERIDQLELKLANVPTHADFKAMTDKLGVLSEQNAVVKERLEGARDSLARIERQVSLFVQAQLERENGR